MQNYLKLVDRQTAKENSEGKIDLKPIDQRLKKAYSKSTFDSQSRRISLFILFTPVLILPMEFIILLLFSSMDKKNLFEKYGPHSVGLLPMVKLNYLLGVI